MAIPDGAALVRPRIQHRIQSSHLPAGKLILFKIYFSKNWVQVVKLKLKKEGGEYSKEELNKAAASLPLVHLLNEEGLLGSMN